MTRTLDQITSAALATGVSAETAANCAWLQACGYPGVAQLLEALGDDRRELELKRDGMGLDLQNVSCVFLGPAILQNTLEAGRVFLRNVRHGLYLLPLSVAANIGIGCPVDPGFALGGERSKNPYGEMLEIAGRQGVSVNDGIWQALEER